MLVASVTRSRQSCVCLIVPLQAVCACCCSDNKQTELHTLDSAISSSEQELTQTQLGCSLVHLAQKPCASAKQQTSAPSMKDPSEPHPPAPIKHGQMHCTEWYVASSKKVKSHKQLTSWCNCTFSYYTYVFPFCLNCCTE